MSPSGASDIQTVKAFLEAEAWPGVSLIIAYSTCIAHGFDMSESMTHQKAAVQSGHWPLYRYRPGGGEATQPFQLDSAAPTVPYADFAGSEARFAMLKRSDPDRAAAAARPRPIRRDRAVAATTSSWQVSSGPLRSAWPHHDRRDGGRVMSGHRTVDISTTYLGLRCAARSWPRPAR